MPLSIEQRLQLDSDSIAGFRSAAELRFREAQVLYNKEKRVGAIYLAGYCAEMTLKAAYFAAVGYGIGQKIAKADMRDALVKTASQLGLQPIKHADLHDISRWAELLVAYRNSPTGSPYSQPTFAGLVAHHAKSVYLSWRESIRYHRYRTLPGEAGGVMSSVVWLRDRSLYL